MADTGSYSKQSGPSSFIHNMLSNFFSERDACKSVFTCFIFENILSSLALETGIVNKSSIMSKTSFQAWLHGDAKIQRQVFLYGVFDSERYCIEYSNKSCHWLKTSGTEELKPACVRRILKCLIICSITSSINSKSQTLSPSSSLYCIQASVFNTLGAIVKMSLLSSSLSSHSFIKSLILSVKNAFWFCHEFLAISNPGSSPSW